jgi:hypothetical protein
MVEGFFIWPSLYIFKIKFSRRYIADILAGACNSRLPQAKGVYRVTDYLLQQHRKLSEPFQQIGKG